VKRLKQVWDVVYEFFDITDRRHLFLLSAGIAFNQLICMIPLILLVISIVSGFIDEQATKETVRLFLTQLMPTDIEATQKIPAIIYELGAVFSYRTLTGWFAGIALLWVASALFSSMRTGLNAIFHIPTPKFFILYKLKDLLLTIITAVLIVTVTLISPALSVIEETGRTLFPNGGHIQILGLTAQLASLIATTVMFFVLYRFVPNRKLHWKIVVMSTIAAVGLWELARVLFTWYVNSATNFNTFYGGYIVAASLALWFYYSAFIFLISAELAQYIYVKRTEHRAPEV
jgi:membrane protein